MSHYLVRLTYPPAPADAPGAMDARPCLDVLLPAVTQAGGRLESPVFAAGETDLLFILEAPETAVAQIATAVACNGTLPAIETTPLAAYADTGPAGSDPTAFGMLPPELAAARSQLRGAPQRPSIAREEARHGAALRRSQHQTRADRLAAQAQALRHEADQVDASRQEATERLRAWEQTHDVGAGWGKARRTPEPEAEAETEAE